MNARGCYGHFPRNIYGHALPYVGQEASPAPPAPSASPIPPGFGALTPGEMDAVRAHRRAMGFMGDAAGPSRSSGGDSSVLSGGYSSVLGRMLVIAVGAFAGYQLAPPGTRRDLAMALGATTATFLNVLQRQANTLDRIADQQAATANRRLF